MPPSGKNCASSCASSSATRASVVAPVHLRWGRGRSRCRRRAHFQSNSPVGSLRWTGSPSAGGGSPAGSRLGGREGARTVRAAPGSVEQRRRHFLARRNPPGRNPHRPPTGDACAPWPRTAARSGGRPAQGSAARAVPGRYRAAGRDRPGPSCSPRPDISRTRAADLSALQANPRRGPAHGAGPLLGELS